jgi:hypothetical protein
MSTRPTDDDLFEIGDNIWDRTVACSHFANHPTVDYGTKTKCNEYVNRLQSLPEIFPTRAMMTERRMRSTERSSEWVKYAKSVVDEINNYLSEVKLEPGKKSAGPPRNGSTRGAEGGRRSSKVSTHDTKRNVPSVRLPSRASSSSQPASASNTAYEPRRARAPTPPSAVSTPRAQPAYPTASYSGSPPASYQYETNVPMTPLYSTLSPSHVAQVNNDLYQLRIRVDGILDDYKRSKSFHDDPDGLTRGTYLSQLLENVRWAFTYSNPFEAVQYSSYVRSKIYGPWTEQSIDKARFEAAREVLREAGAWSGESRKRATPVSTTRYRHCHWLRFVEL